MVAEGYQEAQGNRWKRDAIVAIRTGWALRRRSAYGRLLSEACVGRRLARQVEATMPTIRFLCSSNMVALATILA